MTIKEILKACWQLLEILQQEKQAEKSLKIAISNVKKRATELGIIIEFYCRWGCYSKQEWGYSTD